MQSVTDFTPRESVKRIQSYRRESSFWAEHSLIDLDTGHVAATVRFYGSGSVVYCVIWVSAWRYGYPAAGSTASCRGCGKAGGYGYHKASAAMQEALTDAGVTLAEEIGARGDAAMREALEALGRKLAIGRPYIHYAHA